MAGTETTPTMTPTMRPTPSVPPTKTSTEVDYLSRMTLQIVTLTLTPTPMSTLRPKRLTLSPTFWLVCCWRPS